MGRLFDTCEECGTTGVTLTVVGGKTYCRRCLFNKTYDFDKAVIYCLIHQDDFADFYPASINLFFDMLASGQRTYIEAMESFVSDFLEDYAEWVMSNPEIVPFEIVCEKVRRL